jgi:hypothetical protein
MPITACEVPSLSVTEPDLMLRSARTAGAMMAVSGYGLRRPVRATPVWPEQRWVSFPYGRS